MSVRERDVYLSDNVVLVSVRYAYEKTEKKPKTAVKKNLPTLTEFQKTETVTAVETITVCFSIFCSPSSW